MTAQSYGVIYFYTSKVLDHPTLVHYLDVADRDVSLPHLAINPV